jgi:hypothetical protein
MTKVGHVANRGENTKYREVWYEIVKAGDCFEGLDLDARMILIHRSFRKNSRVCGFG